MKENKKSETTLTATYQYDTDRFHRYQIDDGQFATGRLYVNKDRDDLTQVTVDLLGGGKDKEKEEWRMEERDRLMKEKG